MTFGVGCLNQLVFFLVPELLRNAVLICLFAFGASGLHHPSPFFLYMQMNN